MFKRLMGILFISGMVMAPGILKAVDNTRATPDIVGFGETNLLPSSESSSAVRVDYYGNVLPGRNLSQDVGASSNVWNNVYTKSIFSPRGIFSVHEYFSDVSAKNNQLLGIFTISTTTLGSAGTTYVTADLAQPKYPRNIIVVSSFTVGMTTETVSGTVVIIGTDSLGNPMTETLTLVSTDNATVGIGSVTWCGVSSITIRNVTFGAGLSATGYICVGTGVKIGLGWHIMSNGDVYKVLEAGSDSITYTVNADFNSIQFAAEPDGSKDYNVWYKFNRMKQ